MNVSAENNPGYFAHYSEDLYYNSLTNEYVTGDITVFICDYGYVSITGQEITSYDTNVKVDLQCTIEYTDESCDYIAVQGQWGNISLYNNQSLNYVEAYSFFNTEKTISTGL